VDSGQSDNRTIGQWTVDRRQSDNGQYGACSIKIPRVCLLSDCPIVRSPIVSPTHFSFEKSVGARYMDSVLVVSAPPFSDSFFALTQIGSARKSAHALVAASRFG
jgi:hypothetical protein